MLRPLVAILCPREFTFSEDAALIETAELSAVAEVRTFRLDFNAPLPAEVRAADALILWHNVACTAEVIASLANCRVLIRNGVGYDSVDTGAAARRGIPVCNVPDYGTEEVADHTIALTLALCRQLFPLDAEAKRLGWRIEVAPKLRRLSSLTFGPRTHRHGHRAARQGARLPCRLPRSVSRERRAQGARDPTRNLARGVTGTNGRALAPLPLVTSHARDDRRR
jgi:hypothetical protein